MDEKLRSKNSQLVVIVGDPVQVLPHVIQETGATDLFYEQEAAEPVRHLDRAVLKAIKDSSGDGKQQCQIHGFATHTLHPMEHYLARCKDGVAPSSYGAFTKMFNKLTVPAEVEDVTKVPTLPKDALEKLEAKFGDQMKMPTLEDLGYDKSELQHQKKGGIDFEGGEDFALALLDKMMSRKEWVATFEKPKTSPNALTVDTTGLSPCKLLSCAFLGGEVFSLSPYRGLMCANNPSQTSSMDVSPRVASTTPCRRFTQSLTPKTFRNHPCLCTVSSCGENTTI